MKKLFSPMTRLVLILLAIVLGSALLVVLANHKSPKFIGEVTVIKESEMPDSIKNGTSIWGKALYQNHWVYDAVTDTGDTVKVFIATDEMCQSENPDSLIQKFKDEHQLPYRAKIYDRSVVRGRREKIYGSVAIDALAKS